MGTIALTSISSGDAINAEPLHNNFTTIKNEMNGGLDADNLEAGAVTTTKIADGAVTTVKVADAAVTAVKLATDSVATAKIVDGAVTAAKLAAGAASITGATSTGSGSGNSATYANRGPTVVGTWAAGAKLLIIFSGYTTVNNDTGDTVYVRLYDQTAAAQIGTSEAQGSLFADNKTGRFPTALCSLYTVPAGGGSRTIGIQAKNTDAAGPDGHSVAGELIVILLG